MMSTRCSGYAHASRGVYGLRQVYDGVSAPSGSIDRAFARPFLSKQREPGSPKYAFRGALVDFGKDKPSGPVRNSRGNSGGGYLGWRKVFGSFGVWKVSVRSLVEECTGLGFLDTLLGRFQAAAAAAWCSSKA